MKTPTTQLQQVLSHLIKEGSVSIKQFFYLPAFRTRVSDLNIKHGLILDSSEREKGKNIHGNTYSFPIHKLPTDQKKRAIELYKELTCSIK